MKIAYILPSLANKGPAIVAQNLCNMLLRREYDIDVYYFDSENPPTEAGGYYRLNPTEETVSEDCEFKPRHLCLKWDNSGILENKFKTSFNCPTIKLNRKQLPDFDTYDILHSHMYRPDALLAKIRPHLHNAKIISTIHSHLEKDLAYSYNNIVSAVFAPIWIRRLKEFDHVVTISHFLEKIYSTKISNISTVYNGVMVSPKLSNANKEITSKIENLKKERKLKIIGSYASITRIKGLHQIIELLPHKIDWGMVIMGEGPEKTHLEKLVIKHKIIDRVLFFPYLIDPYNYLNLFDLYAMPSYSEGFGLALVEAACAKVAAICSDIAVFRELFNKKEVSFFTLDNQKSLSIAIDNAYENRHELSENAHAKAISNFTVTSMADGYMKIYERLVNE